MVEKKLRKKQFQASVRPILTSGLISAIVSALTSNNQIVSAFAGFIIGCLIPSMLLIIGTFLNQTLKLKRLPFKWFILATALIIFMVAMVVYFAVGLFIFPKVVFVKSQIIETLLITAGITLLFTSTNILIQLTGGTVIWDVFTGRYFHALEEERIFVFVDLTSSTEFAEKLGSRQFFELLREFHSIVEMCCYFYDGTIYKYLGDGAILVWPGNEECLKKSIQAVLEIRSEITLKQDFFVDKFGCGIAFTSGIHCGKVMVGEIGTNRTEIGFFGDPVNTTQRIQSQCKKFQADILLSEEFYERARKANALLPGLKIQSLKGVALRGKRDLVNLVSLELI